MGKLWSDEQLIVLMEGSEREVNQALQHIIQQADWRETFRWKFVSKEQKAVVDELFFQALTDTFFEVQKGNFRRGSSLKTFFMTIGGRKAARYYQKKKKRNERETEARDQAPVLLEKTSMKDKFADEELEHLLDIAETVGKDCRKAIKLDFWIESKAELAKLLLLKNASQASKKLNRCRERLQEKIRNYPRYQQYFN